MRSPAATRRSTIAGTSSRVAPSKRCVPACVSTSTPCGRDELVRAPLGQQLAVVDDRHAVADALDLAEQMGVEQHGDAAPAQLAEQVAHDPPPDRVERARGLVEQQQARPADQRLRDPEALLHALRHRLDAAAALVAEADQRQQLGALGRAAGRARQALVQVQQLVGARPAGEAEELGQIAERAARRRRTRPRRRTRAPCPPRAARGRRRS